MREMLGPQQSPAYNSENPEGIPQQSPGLRRRSYPGYLPPGVHQPGCASSPGTGENCKKVKVERDRGRPGRDDFHVVGIRFGPTNRTTWKSSLPGYPPPIAIELRLPTSENWVIFSLSSTGGEGWGRGGHFRRVLNSMAIYPPP